jgi:hypothetical protein
MKQIVHETKSLAISTVELSSTVALFDSLLGHNPKHAAYESMVFNLLPNGEPDFQSPLETKHYNTEAEATLGHQELIKKYDPTFTPPLDN